MKVGGIVNALKIFKAIITPFSGSDFCGQKVVQGDVIRKEVDRNLTQR